MAIVNAIPNGQMEVVDYCRTMYILGGGWDKITSGLKVEAYQRRTVQIPVGAGSVGGVAFTNDKTEFLTSDLEPSSFPRWDRLVARKTIVPGTPATSTTPAIAAYPKVEFAILKGAPAQSPDLPALTQDHGGVWEFGLGFWLIPGNNAQAIVDGKVYGHYASVVIGENSSAIVGGGLDNGSSHLILANSDCRVPGAGKVKLRVWISLWGEQYGLYSITLSMLGKTDVTTFRVDWNETNGAHVHMQTVYVELEADVPPGGGTVSFIVQMNAADLSHPIEVRHINAKLTEIMS